MKCDSDSTVYRIAKWDEVFETAESRRHKNLSWVSMPVGFASHGYQSLIDEFHHDAPAIYGSWCALVSLASTMPRRGTLASSRGIPLSLRQIARLTFFPQDNFERLFEWATRPEIGWIIDVSGEDLEGSEPQKNIAQDSPSQCPGNAQASTGLPYPTQQTLPYPTQQTGGVGDGGGGGTVLGKADFDRVAVEAVVRLAEQIGPATIGFTLPKPQRGMIARVAIAAGLRSELLELARACGVPSVRSPKRFWAAGLEKMFSTAGVDFEASVESLKSLLARKEQPA